MNIINSFPSTTAKVESHRFQITDGISPEDVMGNIKRFAAESQDFMATVKIISEENGGGGLTAYDTIFGRTEEGQIVFEPKIEVKEDDGIEVILYNATADQHQLVEKAIIEAGYTFEEVDLGLNRDQIDAE